MHIPGLPAAGPQSLIEIAGNGQLETGHHAAHLLGLRGHLLGLSAYRRLFTPINSSLE
jgi:hypothetical protein